jgi:MtN3 and saliva related transmembrane protein
MVVTGLAVAAAAWGVLMGVSPVLQIRRMVRRRSSRDVSIGYFSILLVGFGLWIGYGIASRNLALIVPNTVALFIGVSTIAIALRLRRRPDEADLSPAVPLRAGTPSPGG